MKAHKNTLNNKQESMMATISAMLVLFTTMLNPLVSAGLAMLLLCVFAIYKYNSPEK